MTLLREQPREARASAQFPGFGALAFGYVDRFAKVCVGRLLAATFLAYRAQKERAQLENDKTLDAIFFFVSRDEAAHAGFYRELIALEMADDRRGTLADLAHVIANFKMPGDGLIPHYQENLKIGGGGISARQFFTRAVLPMLKQLGTTRDELKGAGAPMLGAAS